jgi:hypothetical protein
MVKKYHQQKGFPKNTILPQGKYCLTYSEHAKKEFAKDRYNQQNFILPPTIDIHPKSIFEIEIMKDSDKLAKITCRIPFNEELDLSLAIDWQDKYVKTVWLNHQDDQHETLDLTKYNRP